MKCELCNELAVINSKYCKLHKETARSKWIEMINEQKREQEQLYKIFQESYDVAFFMATEAGNKKQPQPMVVSRHKNMADDNSPIVKEWTVPEGVCGFAWVEIKPANCKLANWLKKTHSETWKYDDYSKCLKYWVFQYNQSYERKMAFAGEFSKQLYIKLKESFELNNIKIETIFHKNFIIRSGGRID